MPMFGGHLSMGFPLGLVLQLFILAAVFLVIFWILKSRSPENSALGILKKRYAKGEITKKEFLEAKKDLR